VNAGPENEVRAIGHNGYTHPFYVSSWLVVPDHRVDATLAWSLLIGVSKPKVFLEVMGNLAAST